MFTHVRSGMDMVAGGGIPRSDPYSFTAVGQPWTVQSWLPEYTYGWAERLGGMRLVVLEQALLSALLAWLVVRLVRTGSPPRTALAALVALGIGSAFWSPRPLLFGLVAMALTVTVVEKRRSHWLLIPVVWLWVNSHGSFPLGLVYLAVRAVGEWRDWRARPADAMRYVIGFVVGLAVAAVNPLGPRLLAFPFSLGKRREVFMRVVEWQSPDFQAPAGRAALVALVIGLALLVRWRAGWRDVLPVAVFVALGLLAVRNLPVAAIVLAPVVARSIRHPDTRPRAGTESPNQRRANLLVAGALAITAVVFAVAVLARSPLDLRRYPVEAVDFLDGAGLLGRAHRLASVDYAGNYLELRYGQKVKVFIDDRVDMYPVAVSNAYADLLGGRRNALEVLSEYEIDVVLWKETLPLTAILVASGKWQQSYLDTDGWVVLQRVG